MSPTHLAFLRNLLSPTRGGTPRRRDVSETDDYIVMTRIIRALLQPPPLLLSIPPLLLSIPPLLLSIPSLLLSISFLFAINTSSLHIQLSDCRNLICIDLLSLIFNLLFSIEFSYDDNDCTQRLNMQCLSAMSE